MSKDTNKNVTLPNSRISSRLPASTRRKAKAAIVTIAKTGMLLTLLARSAGKYPSFAITAICLDAPNTVPLMALLVASNAPRITRSVPQ